MTREAGCCSWTSRKAENARLSATSIREAGWKAAFCLLDRFTYDLEPMAFAAGHLKKRKIGLDKNRGQTPVFVN
ncbi:hypothetical protein DS031_18095 [Bacillus taeanensis]|uniref:Uncharacterized protein n=1 Tax=Bacillus taeanensis TaxID=273032 RepID=A0A366XW12_9BACI|nr:hypothetical protein DS031_18095 [Bacillus taeanensis]